MKKKNKLLNRFSINLLIAVGLITIACSSNEVVTPSEDDFGNEDLYLYAGMDGDEKIPLNLDTYRRLYRLENPDDANMITNEMKTLASGLNISTMPMSGKTFLLVRRNDTSISFPNPEKVKLQVPVYTTKRTGFTYFFDGIVMLRLKEGVSIEEILKREPETTLVKSLLGGTYFLFVEDGDKVLSIANRIYESGLVKACHPSYLAPTILH